jgi:hypothetical protein
MAVNLIEFPSQHAAGQTLWRLPESGWKMPLIATMIVGISSQLCRQTRDRLEAQNRDLQRNLQAEASARTLQAQELEQAREIQQSLMPKQIPQVPGDADRDFCLGTRRRRKWRSTLAGGH